MEPLSAILAFSVNDPLPDLPNLSKIVAFMGDDPLPDLTKFSLNGYLGTRIS